MGAVKIPAATTNGVIFSARRRRNCPAFLLRFDVDYFPHFFKASSWILSGEFLPTCYVHFTADLIGSLKLGNVLVLVHLIFGPRWSINQLKKNPNIAQLETSYPLCFTVGVTWTSIQFTVYFLILCGVCTLHTFPDALISLPLSFGIFKEPTEYEGKKPAVLTKAGNGGVKVCEFVDIFCAHPPNPRQSGRRNQQMFTTPNTQNPTSGFKGRNTVLFLLILHLNWCNLFPLSPLCGTNEMSA